MAKTCQNSNGCCFVSEYTWIIYVTKMLMVIIHIFLFLITTSRSQEASMASRLLLLLQQPQRRRPKISWAIGILALSQLGDRTPLWKKKEKAWMLCIPCIFNECGIYFVTVLEDCVLIGNPKYQFFSNTSFRYWNIYLFTWNCSILRQNDSFSREDSQIIALEILIIFIAS